MKKVLIFISFLILSLSAGAQTNPVEGQTFTYTGGGTSDALVYNFAAPITPPFTFQYNRITSNATVGYLLRIGTDAPSGRDQNMNNTIVRGNYLEWTGTASTSIITHGLFTGHSTDIQMWYNKLVNCPLGLIVKSESVPYMPANTTGGMFYNYTYGGHTGVSNKNVSGIKVYNNTFYMTETMTQSGWRAGVWIHIGDPAIPITGVKIKNNVFYSNVATAGSTPWSIGFEKASDMVGFECDYNVYYMVGTTNNEPIFNIGMSTVTWSQWRAMGYDAHSIIINPQLNTNGIPAINLPYGTNLGTTYQAGLSKSAVWTVGQAPAIVNQSGTWQVGAFINAPSTPPPPEVADYYVATNGSDNNPGTYAEPWATWQKAFATVTAGKTVYIRGGTYYPTGTSFSGSYSGAYASGKSGTSSNRITIQNYPGEVPIMDCINMTQVSSHFGIRLMNCNYWTLKGLHVTRATQHATTGGATGIDLRTSNNNIVENCVVSYTGGPGITVLYESENNFLINCDSHHNNDQRTGGENADGFIIGEQSYRSTPRINTMTGCRAWENSDDGFDHYRANGFLRFDSCWAWRNGYIPDTQTKSPQGDGNGFKMGEANHSVVYTENRTMRHVFNCIAAENYTRGFSQENCNYNMRMFNNFSWSNNQPGFNFVTYSRQDTLINNLSNANGGDNLKTTQYRVNNIFNSDARITSTDYVSLDWNQLDNARKPGGWLPDITFGHPVQTSEVINAGKYVGIPYSGSAPDIGAFEYGAIVIPPITVITSAVLSTSTTTASVTGSVTYGGGGTITGRGMVWSSTTSGPTLETSFYTQNGSGLGSFTAVLNNLLPNTHYYVRAYAINSLGLTGYGSTLTFTTDNSGLILNGLILEDGKFILDDNDNNIYSP